MREELQRLLNADPFVPFRLKLKDGRVIQLADRLTFAVNEFFMIIVQDRGPALRVRDEEVESIDVPAPIS